MSNCAISLKFNFTKKKKVLPFKCLVLQLGSAFQNNNFLIIFLVFLDRFNMLMSKINFKNKKKYFDVFPSKKHFEKQHLLLSQTPL
jgi:hypothetical protein